MSILTQPMTKEQQENLMHSFWIMLRECESRADCNNDVILRRWVDGWYRQWNMLCGTELKPVWQQRAVPGSALWVQS